VIYNLPAIEEERKDLPRRQETSPTCPPTTELGMLFGHAFYRYGAPTELFIAAMNRRGGGVRELALEGRGGREGAGYRLGSPAFWPFSFPWRRPAAEKGKLPLRGGERKRWGLERRAARTVERGHCSLLFQTPTWTASPKRVSLDKKKEMGASSSGGAPSREAFLTSLQSPQLFWPIITRVFPPTRKHVLC